MSKEGFCKSCRNNRCNMCRGYRNGNRSLRCFCRHNKLKPERTPTKINLMPDHPFVNPIEIDLARLLATRRLPDRVSIG